MGSRGAFLAPVLLPLPSCFVNLPRAFIESFIGPRDPSAGAVILELSWETLDGYVQRVCVGWIGGVTRDSELRSDIFEISAEFARCVGLQEHVARVPLAFLGVHVVDMVPPASQVNVEPVTEDDWELIQLHAGLMESEFLRQICVVNDQQVHPIWIHQNVVIRIRVALPVGMEFARLTPNSEVIVAPKERKPTHTSTSLDPEFYYEASAALRLQTPPRSTEVTPRNDEVWVHADTFALLDGAISTHSTQRVAVVAMWKVQDRRNAPSPPSDPVSPPVKTRPECVVARLKCSPTVARGRAVVSHELHVAASFEPLTRVHLRVLRLPPAVPSRVQFHVSPADKQRVSAEMILESLHATEELAIHNGGIVSLGDTNGEPIQLAVSVDFAMSKEMEELEQQLTDVPVGALQKYALLGGGNSGPLSLDRFGLVAASAHHVQQLEALRQLHSPHDVYGRSLEGLAREAPAFKRTLEAIRALVFRDESIARVMLGVKPPGSVVLFGDRGSGKSTMLHALGDHLERDPLSLATPIYVECRSLRGLKMETVKAKLSEAFAEASTNAPAVVLLDNLDALVPQEDEQAGPANDQARRIAEHVILLLHHARDTMWKTTLELNASVKSQLTVLRETNGMNGHAAARALFEVAGTAMLQKSVAVVAATRSDATLHRALRSSGLFDRPVQLMAPNAEQRESIIRDLLTLKLAAVSPHRRGASARTVALDPAIDFSLLSSVTEGYSLRDLANVSDRTLHQFFLRSAQDMDEEPDVTSSSSAPARLLQSDFTHALEGFQPTALVGVDLFKSSVQWRDVGGLSSVRNILKDTLELPTRYAKLYDRAPIKLPAGMLLYGPPGCGKTLLASAVASECGLNFISVKGPEVLNKYIGASEQAIRDLFARAASAAPSVLFLDEFDSIAPRRGADNTGVTDRLVNQLLTFLDGVESRKGVYVLAATSRPDMIDPALLRPGRLDKSLYCGFPNEADRLDILQAVSRNMELADEAKTFLHEIAAAQKSRSFSGADLQALMYSAQLELVHEKLGPEASDSNVILQRHVEKAFHTAKPSTSDSARREFDAMYKRFSKARETDFSVADSDTAVNPEGLKSHVQHQRTALA